MNLNTLKKSYGLYINGQWQDSSDGAFYTSTNPANGQPLAQCAEATREDVDLAVKSAWQAYPAWKATTKEERAAILERIADRIEENASWLATVETMELPIPDGCLEACFHRFY